MCVSERRNLLAACTPFLPQLARRIAKVGGRGDGVAGLWMAQVVGGDVGGWVGVEGSDDGGWVVALLCVAKMVGGDNGGWVVALWL